MAECDLQKDRTWKGQWHCSTHVVWFRTADDRYPLLCPAGEIEEDRDEWQGRAEAAAAKGPGKLGASVNLLLGAAYPSSQRRVTLDYTNHGGVRTDRDVLCLCLWWGSTEWHPAEQLLLHVFDLGWMAHRDFAVKNIHGVEVHHEG